MSFRQIIVCSGTVLLPVVIILALLFFRKIYKNHIKKIIFPLEVIKEKSDGSKKFNELYRRNKQKKLIKQQEILRERQKSMQIYNEDLKIVDIVKPLGKWTRMVMMSSNLMKHFTELVIGREGNKKGFWELFVKEAKSSKVRYKGKGR